MNYTSHLFKSLAISVLALSLGTLSGAQASEVEDMNQKPPSTEAQVDLAAYLGKWYEIASIPARFQKGCINTTATYATNSDGTIAVNNQCEKIKGDKRKATTALGKAWILDSSNAKLEVSFIKLGKFLRWFTGDYWILKLGPKNEEGLYSYSVVGHPKRSYGWILSRTKQLDDATLAEITNFLRSEGYDPASFQKSVQE